MLVINLVKNDFSDVWKLNERNVAGCFSNSANCSILVDDIIDIVSDATSKPFQILNLFIKINNRAYLFKSTCSLFLVFLWNFITLGNLTNLLDGVCYFVNLLLCWLSTTMDDGWVDKDWLRSISFSNTWYVNNSWINPSSIWSCDILQFINRILGDILELV